MRKPGSRPPARKIERLDARPCLSPEEEAALLDHLMHEEDEPVRMPPPGTPFTLIEVEPPRGVSLSDALYRTAEEMRRAGVLDRVLGKARDPKAARKAVRG